VALGDGLWVCNIYACQDVARDCGSVAGNLRRRLNTGRPTGCRYGGRPMPCMNDDTFDVTTASLCRRLISPCCVRMPDAAGAPACALIVCVDLVVSTLIVCSSLLQPAFGRLTSHAKKLNFRKSSLYLVCSSICSPSSIHLLVILLLTFQARYLSSV
jgi:hypothetical protein